MTDSFELPVLWTKVHDNIIQKLEILGGSGGSEEYEIKTPDGSNAGKIKFAFNQEFEWFGLKSTTNGIEVDMSGFKEGGKLVIFTSRNKWIVMPEYNFDYNAKVANAAFQYIGTRFFEKGRFKKESNRGSFASYQSSYVIQGSSERYNELIDNGNPVTSDGAVIVSGKEGSTGSTFMKSNGQTYSD
jgi:hypothetical protein